MISDHDALPALLRTDFSLFLQFAFREVGGAHSYHHNWHIDAIVHELDRVRRGHNRRLIVTMPPRHLKTVTISIAWVAWMLGHHPALKFICVSYGQDLADNYARNCLKIMDTDWYRRAFPKLRLTRRAVSDFETSAGGGRMSTSISGMNTGRGADIVVIDDPMKADEAMGETARTAASDWMENTMLQRLDDQRSGSFILIMQRLHAGDLAGELIRKGGWQELKLSAIATSDELVPIGGGRAYHRRAGHALHERRLPLVKLEEIRARNSAVFAAQFQQEPVPREGNIVNPAWFPRYDEPPTGGIVCQSWDTAVKTGVRNDLSAGITSRYYQGRHYVLDMFHKRVGFRELHASLLTLCKQYGVGRLLIEDASSGQQLIQMLEERPSYVPRPIAVRPEGDKASRFEAQASRIQAGEVVLPQAAPWLADFISEIAAQPNGRHDDQADALAQMLANAPPRFAPPINAGPEIIFVGEFESLNSCSANDIDDPWSGLP